MTFGSLVFRGFAFFSFGAFIVFDTPPHDGDGWTLLFLLFAALFWEVANLAASEGQQKATEKETQQP